jgi:hypothetical protein
MKSLAGQLGSISHPPQAQKPRPPVVDKPQTVAPTGLGATKPRPATPNKPGRAVLPKRPASAPPAAAPASTSRKSVAGQLGSFRRGGRRGR